MKKEFKLAKGGIIGDKTIEGGNVKLPTELRKFVPELLGNSFNMNISVHRL